MIDYIKNESYILLNNSYFHLGSGLSIKQKQCYLKM